MIGINVRNQQPENEEPKKPHKALLQNYYKLLLLLFIFCTTVWWMQERVFFFSQKKTYKLYILTAYFYMNYKLMNPCLELVIKVIAVCGITNRLSP